MKTIFVGGSQRSGTTLLNKFLCLDKSTNPKIAEASYLRELMSAYKNAVLDFDHDSASYFNDKQELKQFHSSIINLFLNRTLSRFSGASTLVLKEPHLTQFFPELFELVPYAQFVLIVRDPRDIISSMIKVGERMKNQGQRHFFQDRNIDLMCQQILSFYIPSLNNTNEAFKKRLFVLKYEDLISNTSELHKKLATFTGLGLDFDSWTNPNLSMQQKDLLEIDFNHPEQKRYLPWITENNAKAMNDSSVGAYKNVLRPEEIELVNRHMQSFMKVFSYSV